MAIDNESEFLASQKAACEIVKEKVEKEEPPEEDKICPTCTPDESFVAPNWWTLDKPFLNKKTCEYSIGVAINEFGDTWTIGSLRESGMMFEALKRTYVRPGIRMLLQHYGKMESDDIICAAPPKELGDKCGKVFDIGIGNYVKEKTTVIEKGESASLYTTREIDQSIIAALGRSTNLEALELYAKATEFKFSTLSESGILSVLITIPAYIFDKVPDAPELPEIDTNVEKLEIQADKLHMAMIETVAALRVFATFQSYFYQSENGNLFEKESGNTFYIKFLANRINDFNKTLEALIEANNFSYGDGMSFMHEAHTVQIFFDKSDEKLPFNIKKIRVKRKNCQFVRMKKGMKSFLKKWNGQANQTTLGYIAKIDKIHLLLTAKKTPPWLDFVLEYTYPQLAIDYGSSLKFKDKQDGACLDDLNAINANILKSVLQFSKSFEYYLNKANCVSLQGKEYLFEKTPGDFNIDKFKEDRGLPNIGITRENFKSQTFQGNYSAMTEYVYHKYEEGLDEIKQSSPLHEALADFTSSFEGDKGASEKLKKLISMFNPCTFKEFTKTLLKCLFRGMSANTAYMLIIKKTLGSLASEALEIVIQALPADKQATIREQVENDFRGMPAPWSPNWKGGSLSAARTSKGKENIKNHMDQRLSVSGRLDEVKNKIKEIFENLRYNGYDFDLKVSFATSDSDGAPQLNWGIKYVPTDDLGWISENVSSSNLPENKISVLTIVIEPSIEGIEKVINEFQHGDPNRFMLDFPPSLEEGLAGYEEKQWAINEKHNFYKGKQGDLKIIEEGKIETISNAQDSEDPTTKRNIARIQKRIDKINKKIKKIDADILDNKKPFNPKKIKKESIMAIIKELSKLEAIRGQAANLSQTLQETVEYAGWDSMTIEQQDAMIAKEGDKTTFARLNPESDFQQGTLGAALGNTQQAITKAYVDAIIESAEIQEIMSALDRVPGMDLLGKFISSFKCPRNHYIFPPIDSFLSTLTFDPCGKERLDMALPEILYLPNISGWTIIKNLVGAFIIALKATIKEALMALIAKFGQMLFSGICRLIGGQNPLELGELLTAMGREDCAESEILKAALNAGPGDMADISNEDFKDLANAISNGGPYINMKEALTGREDYAYCSQVAKSISVFAPKFQALLPNAEAVCEFFTMAGALVSDEQKEALIADTDAYPILENLRTRCLPENETYLDMSGLGLPDSIVDEYLGQEQAQLANSAEEVIDAALNGLPLKDILDSALSNDPDCRDKFNNDKVISVGKIMQKATTTESFQAVQAGIFGRVKKAFLDDVIQWNLFEVWDSPGILGTILSDKKGNTLNYYSLFNRAPRIIRVFLPEAGELPNTVGIDMRDQLLESNPEWNNKPSVPNISLDYVLGSGGLFPETTKVQLFNDLENQKSLGFKFKYETPEFSNATITINEVITEENEKILKELEPFIDVTEKINYRTKILKAMVNKSWNEFSNYSIDSKHVEKIITGINSQMFNNLINSMLVDESNILGIPQGFRYGYKPIEITAEDLTYVAPNGSKYNFEETDQVLGRSKTSNPRVQFLDPAQHGGTYKAPFYNILAEEKEGWSLFAKAIVSTTKGCEEADSNFLFLQDIMDNISKDQNSIKPDERIELSPDCVREKPFDKIASPSTLATLGGVTTATIRMYLIDYLLRTFSINGSVEMGSLRNKSNIISKFIVRRMKAGLHNERSFWATTYEGGVYWLLFLEQAVQLLKRKTTEGIIQTTPRMEELFKFINNLQQAHKTPGLGDLQILKDIKEMDYTNDAGLGLAATIATGALIAASGLAAPATTALVGTIGIAFGAFSLSQARLSAKLGTIYYAEKECMELLGYLIDEQLDYYGQVLDKTMYPRPKIYDVSKYLIGASKMSIKQTVESGLSSVEIPIGGKSNYPYGDIDHCVSDINTENPLDALSPEMISPEIREFGGFYLEKYLRIIEKPPVSAIMEKFNRQFITNRDSNLKNVVNIKDFKRFLIENRSKISADAHISDYFGDAKMMLIDDAYNGSVGIKFGVRLCLVMPSGFSPFTSTAQELENHKHAKKEKSFILRENTSLKASRYIFPICSYEEDIMDHKLSSYIEADDNFNQDLKCYVDGLTLTPSFRLFADHIINVKKVPSLVSIYSYLNFYSSLGRGAGERDDPGDEDELGTPELSNIFNDTRHELRKLFVSNYKRNDFDPSNEEDDADKDGILGNLTRKALARTLGSVYMGVDVPFWWKWKNKQKKVDEDGKPCGNQFAGLTAKGK